jgi:hypothetical protein
MGLRSIYIAKETTARIKRKSSDWGRIFASYSLDKGLLYRIYKELKKLNIKRKNNPTNKWAN